ncbi:MAG: tetratricopeptide repeat protein [Clostridiales bacterium]|nr:tetratricopeptide repeat protein [Clostridiales bacterium]
MICKNCGTEIGNSAFCFECGAKAEPDNTETKVNVSENIAEINNAGNTEKADASNTASNINNSVNAPVNSGVNTLPENKGNKNKIFIAAGVCAVILIAAAAIGYKPLKTASENKKAYNAANELYEQGNYAAAMVSFENLGDYKDAVQRAADCNTAMYQDSLDFAIECYNKEDYTTAITWFKDAASINDTAEAEEWLEKCYEGVYQYALAQYNNGNYIEANTYFGMISGYKDADEMADDALKSDLYTSAVESYNAGDYEGALELFNTITGYKDVDSYIDSINTKAMLENCKQAYINYLSESRSYGGYAAKDLKYFLYDIDNNGIPELYTRESAGPEGDLPTYITVILTYDGSLKTLYKDTKMWTYYKDRSGQLYFSDVQFDANDIDLYKASIVNGEYVASVAYSSVYSSDRPGDYEYSSGNVNLYDIGLSYFTETEGFSNGSNFSAIYNYS